MVEVTEAIEEQTTEATEQQVQAQGVEFPQAPADQNGGDGSIDMILNMNVPVMVALGQTQISVKRLLQLSPGSVLKLNQSVSAPVELYLKDSKFATGDVVVVEDQFAIRIKSIIGLNNENGGGETAQ